MKLYMYSETPKRTMPKWIKIPLIVILALFTVLLALISVVLAINDLALGLLFFTPMFLWYFGLIAIFYNRSKAYMEIDGDSIYITDYLVFKERKRFVHLSDIQTIKWRRGVKGPSYLLFKDLRSKTLFKTADLPEIKFCFMKLGFKIS